MGQPEGETPTPTRGRPRPEVTKSRDERVLAIITEAGEAGVTRKAIHEQLVAEAGEGVEVLPGAAYLSLYRLRTTDQVHKAAGNAHAWVAGPKPEAPVA